MTVPLSADARRLAEIAHEAGRIILDHYAEGAPARLKDDRSPVTAADEEAEALILERLAESWPDVPVIAEEAVAGGTIPKIGRRFFLVDPLDGTKEFLARNGEFTVNIALIEDGVPVLGMVLAPAKERLFLGDLTGAAPVAVEAAAPTDYPAHLDHARRLRARPAPKDGLIAVASRTHRDKKTEEYLARYPIKDFIAAGSSLKFCLIAAGEADIYPRHGRTMEWDTAAGHAVLAAAGGTLTGLDGEAFLYGKWNKGFANPFFVARGAA